MVGIVNHVISGNREASRTGALGQKVFLDIHRLRIDTSNLIRGRLPKGLGMNLGNLGNRPGIVPNY